MKCASSEIEFKEKDIHVSMLKINIYLIQALPLASSKKYKHVLLFEGIRKFNKNFVSTYVLSQ